MPRRVSVQPVELREPFGIIPGALVPCRLLPEPTLSLLDMQEMRFKGHDPLLLWCCLDPSLPLVPDPPPPSPSRSCYLGSGALPPLWAPGLSADSVAASLLRKSKRSLPLAPTAAPTSRHLHPFTQPASLPCDWIVVLHVHSAPPLSPTQGQRCGVSLSLLEPFLHAAPIPFRGDH